MNRFFAGAVAVALLLMVTIEAHPIAGKSASAGNMQGSYRFERNGWIYVHVEGPPERMGYQHGYLLAQEIGDLLSVIKPMWMHTTHRDWKFYRQTAEQMLWPKIDAEYQHEIDGIVAGMNARGVKSDRWDIVALNALEELADYYVPWLDKQQGRTPETHSPGNCSAFIATGSFTKDHRIVMGHNNWTNYMTGSRWNIIFDLKPEKGYRILMDGLPGVIASDDDFGVNSNGIMITETTITQFFGFDPNGKPNSFARARQCSTAALSTITCGSCWTATTVVMPMTGSSATTRPARLRSSNWA